MGGLGAINGQLQAGRKLEKDILAMGGINQVKKQAQKGDAVNSVGGLEPFHALVNGHGDTKHSNEGEKGLLATGKVTQLLYRDMKHGRDWWKARFEVVSRRMS